MSLSSRQEDRLTLSIGVHLTCIRRDERHFEYLSTPSTRTCEPPMRPVSASSFAGARGHVPRIEGDELGIRTVQFAEDLLPVTAVATVVEKEPGASIDAPARTNLADGGLVHVSGSLRCSSGTTRCSVN